MSHKNNNDTAGFDYRHFEKNRYFQGKLMSARDMVTDQQYHANRLELLAQHTTGTGIVTGFGISNFEATDEGLEVTIQPGLAIDSTGKPIVVRNPTTRSFPIPDGNELYLFIEHDTETKDPVPVPGSGPLSEEQSEESRILEVFSLTTREAAPAIDTPPTVEFPDVGATDKDIADLASEVANTYHDAHRSAADPDPDAAVFLGSFKRGVEGNWRLGSETDRRPLVYDNEMLFSMLASHIADAENPHQTQIGEPAEYIESELDQMDELSLRIQQLQADLTDVSDKLDVHTDYTTRKSLKSTVRFFDDLATSFERQTEVSRLSLTIVESIRNRFADKVYADRETYIAFVGELLADMEAVADELDGQVTPRSHSQFRDAVDSLADAVDDDQTIIAVATALNSVGEAAEMAEKQTKVVSDEAQ